MMMIICKKLIISILKKKYVFKNLTLVIIYNFKVI